MFKLRLISAIVLIPVVVLGILKMDSVYMAVASGIVFAYAAWEWIQMTIKINAISRVVLLVAFVAVAFSLFAAGFNIAWMYWLSLCWWVVAFIGVLYFPKGKQVWKYLFLQPLVGLVMFVPAWVAFNQLHQQGANGPVWVLLGCLLVWGADIGAYCTGKMFGKTKLLPQVSPGKTIAGFYGAILTGLTVMLVFYLIFKPQIALVYLLWLGLATVLAAVLGDLVESMLKRVCEYKDSGVLIPGHGGMYDRLDSMLAAFPIYVLGLQLLQNVSIMRF